MLSTLPRCRCRPQTPTTSPGSSAATARGSARPGASSSPAGRPCWCWPTCEKARPSPAWRRGSASARRPPGATSARPWPCWPPAPRSCAGRCAQARDAGHAYVVIDGTLIPIDRVAADRPFYSGKHRRHGMNLQVISAQRVMHGQGRNRPGGYADQQSAAGFRGPLAASRRSAPRMGSPGGTHLARSRPIRSSCPRPGPTAPAWTSRPATTARLPGRLPADAFEPFRRPEARPPSQPGPARPGSRIRCPDPARPCPAGTAGICRSSARRTRPPAVPTGPGRGRSRRSAPGTAR